MIFNNSIIFFFRLTIVYKTFTFKNVNNSTTYAILKELKLDPIVPGAGALLSGAYR